MLQARNGEAVRHIAQFIDGIDDPVAQGLGVMSFGLFDVQVFFCGTVAEVLEPCGVHLLLP
jgi:hypothetical protein